MKTDSVTQLTFIHNVSLFVCLPLQLVVKKYQMKWYRNLSQKWSVYIWKISYRHLCKKVGQSCLAHFIIDLVTYYVLQNKGQQSDDIMSMLFHSLCKTRFIIHISFISGYCKLDEAA